MDSFKHAQSLYLDKQIDKDRRKTYKSCNKGLPVLEREKTTQRRF
nr:hypothetical protein [Candidatus Sigynarchaeota archaeon]